MLSLRTFGKDVVAHLVGRFGYELKIREAPLRDFPEFLAQCRARGLRAATVFDAGVGTGTPWLYEAFADSKIVLFEPLSRFCSVIEELKTRYDIEAHATALGDETGQIEISVPQHFATSASMKRYRPNFLDAIERRDGEWTFETETIQIARLDDLNTYEAPFVLKIDVEGFELELLQGATKTLERTELIIVEASLIERYENGSTLLDVANFLDQHGFALYEIVDMGTRDNRGVVGYVDAAFVPKGSALRAL